MWVHFINPLIANICIWSPSISVLMIASYHVFDLSNADWPGLSLFVSHLFLAYCSCSSHSWFRISFLFCTYSSSVRWLWHKGNAAMITLSRALGRAQGLSGMTIIYSLTPSLVHSYVAACTCYPSLLSFPSTSLPCPICLVYLPCMLHHVCIWSFFISPLDIGLFFTFYELNQQGPRLIWKEGWALPANTRY
jgi:hypothetical protein